jgi:hypothetical protein
MARIRAATNMFSQAVQTMKDKTVSSLSPIPGVVLVHGAYGSSWPAVIQCLQGAGLAVIAVQNPLTSLAGTPRTPVTSWRCDQGP